MHYSPSPLTCVHSTQQNADYDLHAFNKPKGLWLSVEGEDDWKAWCESEQFMTARLKYIHEIQLHDDADIIRLTCRKDMEQFTKRYGRKSEFARRFSFDERAIQWTRVANEHQGIIIAPYIWSARLELNWYYGWDCASGCIWDSNAVNTITPLGTYHANDT